MPVDSKQQETAFLLSSLSMGEDKQTIQAAPGEVWLVNSVVTFRLHFGKQFISNSVAP